MEIFKILTVFNRRFFYNEPFWDMSGNEGRQIFVKIDLKVSIYSPDNKSEGIRTIGVTVDFWEPAEIDKNGDFW